MEPIAFPVSLNNSFTVVTAVDNHTSSLLFFVWVAYYGLKSGGIKVWNAQRFSALAGRRLYLYY